MSDAANEGDELQESGVGGRNKLSNGDLISRCEEENWGNIRVDVLAACGGVTRVGVGVYVEGGWSKV